MNILVTGGNGFIGSNLLKMLYSDPSFEKIYVVTRAGSSNRNIPSSSRIIKVPYDGTIWSLQPAVASTDCVIHLAAFYSTRGDAETVNRLIKDNIIFSTHLMQSISFINPKVGFISTSTFSSFDDQYRYAPQSFYAATKSAVEVLAAGFDLRSVFLRLPDTYGSHDWRAKVHNLLRDAVYSDDPMFDFQKPTDQEVNLIHVNDVCRALLHSVNIANDGNGSDVSFYDLFYPENNITLGEIASALIENSNIGVSFPLFGDITQLPPQKNPLPLFTLNHNPHIDLAKTIYLEEKK